MPNYWTKSENVVSIASKESFSYRTNVNDCAILNKAVQRYSWEFLFRNLSVTPGNNLPILSTVDVEIGDELVNLCNEYPQLETDIEYEACKYFVCILYAGDWSLILIQLFSF